MVQHFYLMTTWQRKSGWRHWGRAKVIFPWISAHWMDPGSLRLFDFRRRRLSQWLESRFHYWSHWKKLKTTRSSQSFLWGQSFDQWSEWMFEVIPTNHYISSFATWSIDDYEAEWECKREPLFSKYLTTLNKIIWNLFSKRTTVIKTFFLYFFFISFIEKNPLTVYRKSYIRKFYWLWAIRKN